MLVRSLSTKKAKTEISSPSTIWCFLEHLSTSPRSLCLLMWDDAEGRWSSLAHFPTIQSKEGKKGKQPWSILSKHPCFLCSSHGLCPQCNLRNSWKSSQLLCKQPALHSDGSSYLCFVLRNQIHFPKKWFLLQSRHYNRGDQTFDPNFRWHKFIKHHFQTSLASFIHPAAPYLIVSIAAYFLDLVPKLLYKIKRL